MSPGQNQNEVARLRVLLLEYGRNGEFEKIKQEFGSEVEQRMQLWLMRQAFKWSTQLDEATRELYGDCGDLEEDSTSPQTIKIDCESDSEREYSSSKPQLAACTHVSVSDNSVNSMVQTKSNLKLSVKNDEVQQIHKPVGESRFWPKHKTSQETKPRGLSSRATGNNINLASSHGNVNRQRDVTKPTTSKTKVVQNADNLPGTTNGVYQSQKKLSRNNGPCANSPAQALQSVGCNVTNHPPPLPVPNQGSGNTPTPSKSQAASASSAIDGKGGGARKFAHQSTVTHSTTIPKPVKLINNSGKAEQCEQVYTDTVSPGGAQGTQPATSDPPSKEIVVNNACPGVTNLEHQVLHSTKPQPNSRDLLQLNSVKPSSRIKTSCNQRLEDKFATSLKASGVQLVKFRLPFQFLFLDEVLAKLNRNIEHSSAT